MPSASEFSTNPDANTTVGGTNVGENCSPAGLNNAVRYLAATLRDLFDRVPALGVYLPTAGGLMDGTIARRGRGAYIYHASSQQNDGAIYFLPEGSPRPPVLEGVVVFYY